jgi:hypothetical protein
LTDLESEQSSLAFFEAAVAVRAASRRFLFAKGMMRIAYLTAIQTHIDLPPRAKRLFQEFAKKSWRPEDANLFSSEIPNIALMIRPDDVDTGEFSNALYSSAILTILSGRFDRAERTFREVGRIVADNGRRYCRHRSVFLVLKSNIYKPLTSSLVILQNLTWANPFPPQRVVFQPKSFGGLLLAEDLSPVLPTSIIAVAYVFRFSNKVSGLELRVRYPPESFELAKCEKEYDGLSKKAQQKEFSSVQSSNLDLV